MSAELTSPAIGGRTIALLKAHWPLARRYAGVFFVIFAVANLARGLFPGVYTFNPFHQGWLLMPEAVVIGPCLALLHNGFVAPGTDFAWSRDNRLVKFGKAAVNAYALMVLFKVGVFLATQAVPALIGFVLGPAVGSLFPLVVGAGLVAFLMFYCRFLLAFALLHGEERECLTTSWRLTRGKAWKILSCLLLLAAPVLIPWGAAWLGGDHWLELSDRGVPRTLPILFVTLLQTASVIIITPGLCAMYEALTAEDGETDKMKG